MFGLFKEYKQFYNPRTKKYCKAEVHANGILKIVECSDKPFKNIPFTGKKTKKQKNTKSKTKKRKAKKTKTKKRKK